MQVLENHIQKNYDNWRKCAEKYTRSKEFGQYLLSDVLVSILENKETSERMCVEGYLDAYVRKALYNRRYHHLRDKTTELTGDVVSEDNDHAAFDNEVMLMTIDLAASQLPRLDQQLIRAYKLGLKPSEIAQAVGVEPVEVYDKIEMMLRKIKRRIKQR